jgi:hypothetical protein
MRSEPVDEAVLYRAPGWAPGTLNGLLSVSTGLWYAEPCCCAGYGGGACAGARGGTPKCSGRRWPGLGLLKRWPYSSLGLFCFNGFRSGLVSPNCGVDAFNFCRGFGAGAGASLCCGAGGSRSRTMVYGFLVDFNVVCGRFGLSSHLAKRRRDGYRKTHIGLSARLSSSNRLLEFPKCVTEFSSKKELSFSASSCAARFAAFVWKAGFCREDRESTGRKGARCFRGLVFIDWTASDLFYLTVAGELTECSVVANSDPPLCLCC